MCGSSFVISRTGRILHQIRHIGKEYATCRANHLVDVIFKVLIDDSPLLHVLVAYYRPDGVGEDVRDN